MKSIVIFNGWGMDENVISHLIIPKDYTLKIVNFPYILDLKELSNSEKVIFIGWSFGAYYLTKFIQDNKIKNSYVIYINGNSNIIGEYGILPKMFEFTLKTLTPETLKKFYFNMGINEDKISIKKTFDEILEELKFFKNSYKPLSCIANYIVVGKKDRIVPTNNQLKFIENNKVKSLLIECEHYPFENNEFLISLMERIEDEF